MIQIPAAANANPAPNPAAFFAAADIAVLPWLSGPVVFLTPLPNTPAALPIFPNMPTTDPATLSNVPSIRSTGPTAAAIAANFTIFLCIAGLILLNASITFVILSTIGFKYSLAICPMLYFMTSKEEFNFSSDPPIPDRRASAILCDVPDALSNALAYFCTLLGDASISVIHFAIWFFPKIADAAVSFCWLFNPENALCSCF